MRWLTVLCCLIWGLAVSAAQATPLWSPSAEVSSALQRSVDARWQRYFGSGTLQNGTTSRELIALALDGLASHYDDARIAQSLTALASMQDRDPASRSYGNMLWYAGDKQITDRNGVEFVMRHATLLWLLYADRLTPAQRAPLQAMLELARTGVTRHSVNISYTNIYLMKAWNLVALGNCLNDAALSVQGKTMLRDWLRYTARVGISEYLSPTYYGVDLDNLALLRNLAPDDETRTLASAGLDAVWSDIALHWYAPAARLGGTHSRDYSRLFSLGDINTLVARAGWLGSASNTAPKTPYNAYAFAMPSASAAKWLSAPLPRFIESRWGEEPQQRLSHYLGKNLSVASAQANYYNMDTAPLAISLGSGQDVPVISFLMEGRRDYYGTQRIVEPGSGHLKSLHLRPFLASVQHEREVLFAASGSNDSNFNSALESVLILPADASFWLDDKPLDFFTHTSQWRFEPAPDGQTTQISIHREQAQNLLRLRDQDSSKGLGVSRNFPVTAGERYRFSARLRGGEIALYLNFYDAAHQLIGGEHIERIQGGTDFSTHDFEQRAPEGAVSVRAWLYSTIAGQTEIELAALDFAALDAQGGAARTLGSFDFEPFVAQSISIAAGQTLFVQREDVAVALRPLGAWDTHNQPMNLQLINDGLANQAVRLNATHSATHSTTPSTERGTFAMWVSAAEDLRNASDFARFRADTLATPSHSSFDGQLLDLRTAKLHLQLDTARKQVLQSEGAASTSEQSVRRVNGIEASFVPDIP
jgi:hypothetical protein